MSLTLVIVIIVIVTALVFDFTNGFHDSANAMATSVATGALSPRVAVLIAAILNFVGASMSVEVAKTISSGIVNDALVTPEAVFAGLAGAIIWNLITWLAGLPSSSSHAMFGGLIGAIVAAAGLAGVHPGVIVSKVLLPALVAPIVAGVASLIATRVAYRVTDHTTQHAATVFRFGQRISASMVALAHGTSDGQKTMGVITLVLVAGGYQASGGPEGTRPHEWVIAAAAAAMALGTYSGGWRIMRTMGKRLVDIQPPQGFASESAATVAILASSHLGFALSTTHVCSGAIIGSGVGGRATVNWSIARRMLYAWLLTLPAAAIVGALASLLTRLGIGGFITVLVLLAGSSLAILIAANRNKIGHHNVTADEEPAAAPGMRRFGPGPDRPVSVIDGISWTNARDRVSGGIQMTAHAESTNGPGNSGLITIMSDDQDEDEDASDLTDDSHIVPDGR